MRESVLTWREFRGLARHQQFLVAMLVAYALLMCGVTVLFAASGEAAAVVTLAVGLAVGIAAVTVVPSRLASWA